MRRHFQSSQGFGVILLAIGFVLFLGLSSMFTNTFTLMDQKRKVEKVNRIEGFYLGEFIAWHQYTESKREPGQTGAKRGVTIEFRIDASLPESLKDEPYLAEQYEPGVPVNVKTALAFDPNSVIFRRVSQNQMELIAKTSCGTVKYSGARSSYRTCLFERASPPGGPLVFLKAFRPLDIRAFQSFDEAYGIGFQNDMKILVLGKRGGVSDGIAGNPSLGAINSSFSLYLVRYQSDGTLDNSFGDYGRLKIGSSRQYDIGSQAEFLIRRDGKIVVSQGGNLEGHVLFFAQLTANGEPDPNFFSTPTLGLLQMAINYIGFTPFSLTMPFDKYFVALGRSMERSSSPADKGFALTLLKVLSDGKIDGHYQVSVTKDVFNKRSPRATEDGTGRFLTIFTEKDQKDPTLFRILPDGKLDSSFGEKGKPLWELKAGERSSFATTLAQVSENKVLAAGTYKGDFALMRYNEDGTLDTRFGTEGKTVATIPGGATLQDALVADDGKIIGVGITGDDTQDQAILARWNKDGSLDSSFGSNGITKSQVGDATILPNRLALDPKGNIYLVGRPFQDSSNTGSQGYDFGITRFLANGTIDSTFGTKGKVETKMGLSFDSVAGVMFQPDGKIVVAGTASAGGSSTLQPVLTLARFLEDGTVDNSFGTEGRIRPKSTSEKARDLASQMKTMGRGSMTKLKLNDRTATGVGCGVTLQNAGKLVMTSCGQPKLVSYLPDGTMDGGFTDGDEPGIVKLNLNPNGIAVDTTNVVNPLTPPLKQSDGKVMVAGQVGQNIVIARVDHSGSLDKSFADQGLATHKVPAGDMSVPTSLFFQGDMKILVGGHWGDFIRMPSLAGVPAYAYRPLGVFLLRTHADGKIDPSFGNNGVVTKELGEGSEISAAQIQSDGKIVVAGWSSKEKWPHKKITLLRFTSDGALDLTFGNNGIVLTNVIENQDEYAKAMLILPDDRILISGSCYQSQTWYNETFQRRQWMMALYKSNGELDASFGANGILKLFPDLGSEASAITMRADGLIAVAGTVTGAVLGPSGDSDILVALFSTK